LEWDTSYRFLMEPGTRLYREHYHTAMQSPDE
jgi:hypothetical protein